MPITHVHSYLVHPSKHEEGQPDVRGTQVPLEGKLFAMLSAVFAAADGECDVDIMFRPRADGTQSNDCRGLLVAYVGNPTVVTGRHIAARLQARTTRRSGLGLLFLIVAGVGRHPQLLVARFPADSGVVAEETQRGLDVEFIERVFMKNSKAYKSVLYEAHAAFWDGRAVDKQINEKREISQYWINDFLDSELRTTAAHGSKRLAVAFRDAIATAPDAIKHELLFAAQTTRNQNGRAISPATLVHTLNLSEEATMALRDQIGRAEIFDERFTFDRDEFDKHVAFRLVRLSNGGVMVASNPEFDQIFRRQQMDDAGGRTRFTTEGEIVEERLRRTQS